MSDHRQLEKWLKNASLRSRDSVNRAVLQDLLDQWDEPVVGASDKPRQRRRFMQRKMGPVAVAAVVLIVVLLGWLNWGSSGSGVALGDIMASVCKRPWMHVTSTIDRAGDSQMREEWECFDPKIHIWIDPNGVIHYRDYSQGTAYVYQPGLQTLTVSSTTDRFNQREPASPAEGVQVLIARFESQGNEVIHEQGTYAEKQVTIFTLKDEHQEMILTVDNDQQIPLTMKATATIPETGECVEMLSEFDYPDQGPLDIYSLGVPADVQVIDNRPQGDVQDLMDEVQSHFDAGYPDHMAMVLDSWVDDNDVLEPKEIIMLRQQGQKKRVDRYHAFHFTGSKSDWPTLYPQIRDRWPKQTLAEVVALEDTQYAEYQLIYDGVDSTQRTNFSGNVQMTTMRVDLFQSGDMSSLAGFAWCNPQRLLITGKDQTVKPEFLSEDPNHPGWIGFRLVTSMHDPDKRLLGTTIQKQIEEYWFDPARDYLLMKRKSRSYADEGNHTFLIQTLECAQTSSGQWYPKVILTESSSPNYKGEISSYRQEQRILVDTQPTFDPSVFDKVTLKQRP